MSFRIAMLDPSAFTVPYDDHLCRALARTGAEVSLYTRAARRDEQSGRISDSPAHFPGGRYQTIKNFYRLSERALFLSNVQLARKAAKAAEHVWNMMRLARHLRFLRPDVIHFQWVVVPAVDRRHVNSLADIAPCVLTVHDINAFLAPSSRIQKLGWRDTLTAFDRLIVHTQAGKRALIEKGLDDRRISVIPHGVFGEAPEEGDSRQDPPATHACTLLAFGQIKPYKGLDILIRALGEVPEHLRQKLRLIVAGDPGASEAELRGLAHSCGVTQSIEWILRYIRDEEIPELFGRSDALVFPYREIDASGALMTALPFGKAIVASRLGLFAELFTHGETALLVEPENPQSLAAALSALADDPQLARDLGTRARALATDVPSWDHIAGLTLQAYADASRNQRLYV